MYKAVIINLLFSALATCWLVVAIRCPSERGLVYDECGNPCRKTCDNYHQQIRCLQPCVASCQCLAGMVEHNGYCVPPSSCPRL